MSERDLKRDLREVRVHLRNLTQAVDHALSRFDAAMQGPSTEQRGRTIAAVSNALDMQNQIAKRFGLNRRKPRRPPARARSVLSGGGGREGSNDEVREAAAGPASTGRGPILAHMKPEGER